MARVKQKVTKKKTVTFNSKKKKRCKECGKFK